MSAPIVDKINSAVSGFHERTGVMPQHIYLGRMEYRELKRFAAECGRTIRPPTIRRPRVRGLYIYQVDADSHLVCA